MSKLRLKSANNAEENKNGSDKTQEDKKGASWSVLCGGIGKCEIPITEKQKIVLSINKNEESGDVLLDIRMHVSGKKYTGLTSKGITIPLEKTGKFKDKLIEILGSINLKEK